MESGPIPNGVHRSPIDKKEGSTHNTGLRLDHLGSLSHHSPSLPTSLPPFLPPSRRMMLMFAAFQRVHVCVKFPMPFSWHFRRFWINAGGLLCTKIITIHPYYPLKNHKQNRYPNVWRNIAKFETLRLTHFLPSSPLVRPQYFRHFWTHRL